MTTSSTVLIVRRPGKVAFIINNDEANARSFDALGFQTSSDGSFIALIQQQAVIILDGTTLSQVASLGVSGVSSVDFSSINAFLVTMQKPGSAEGSDKNLKVWSLPTGQLVLQLSHRSRGGGPALQFSAQDTLACLMVTNTVHVYNTRQWNAGESPAPAHRLMMKNISSFAANPVKRCIAVFVPESKGAPGHVGIYDYSGAGSEPTVPTTIARKAFYRASAVKFNWNKSGSAVLAMAVSDVDVTNQSYYGEQKLHFLAADGSEECTVPLPKDGPIHDVQWSPSGEHFVAVAGFMPAKITLFTSKCKSLADLGMGPFNMVRWNPFSHFFAVAGFGNLPGDVAFYEKQKGGKCQQLGKTRAENGVTCCWSPDGRSFLTATVAPRLRVDNGYVIYKYDGTLLDSKKFEVLLEASWKPAPEGSFEDRPPSPASSKQAASSSGTGSSGKPMVAPSASAQPSSYVPPALRGKTKPGAASFNAPGAAGMAAASKSASKNAKKRANKKKTSEEDAVENVTQGIAEVSTSDRSAASSINNGAKESAADTEKRIRNLRKKLNQIEQLKAKRDAEGAAAMDPDQIKKIATEAGVVEELAKLGAQVS